MFDDKKAYLNHLMNSCMHMLINRIFKSQNRKHEMVYYDFLVQYYKSNVARNMIR